MNRERKNQKRRIPISERGMLRYSLTYSGLERTKLNTSGFPSRGEVWEGGDLISASVAPHGGASSGDQAEGPPYKMSCCLLSWVHVLWP